MDTNSLCLDIGCDHALLDIYLVKEKNQVKAIASDIAEGPLEKAKENIKKYQVEDKVEIRLGDGLTTYTDEVDTAIASGIGGRTIIGIFKNNLKITKKLKQIIISPNNYQMDVRKFFTSIGFYIEDEELVKDGKYIYQIIKFKKGRKHYSKKELFFGPILLTKKNKLFKDYFSRELNSRKIMIDLLPKNFRVKKYKTKKEIKMIEKEL
ncbi:MAG: SAM-dependent methyltransferase [Bacilli bacterium]|nr:SAM-dependent methyltransferase [Bacilli bacterium]